MEVNKLQLQKRETFVTMRIQTWKESKSALLRKKKKLEEKYWGTQ